MTSFTVCVELHIQFRSIHSRFFVEHRGQPLWNKSNNLAQN